MSKRDKLAPADQYFFERYGTTDLVKVREAQAKRNPTTTVKKRKRQGDNPPAINLAAKDLQSIPNSSNILKGDTLYRSDGSCLPRAAIRGVKQKNE